MTKIKKEVPTVPEVLGTNMITRAHSKLGASSSDRWMNCPGSVSLCEAIPKRASGGAAREGTAAHALAEKVLLEEPSARYYIGKEHLLGPEFNDYGIKCTEEMADFVQDFADYVRRKKVELGAELVVEKRFHLSHIHPDLFGTADVVLIQPFGEIWVIDFKYGVHYAVEAEDNSQLLYYAVGAASGEDFNKITVCIYQPRAHHEEGPVRTWSFEPPTLNNFAKKLRQKALETEREDAPLVYGKWCFWCDAAGVCPALHKANLELARTDFEDPQMPEPKSLTDAQIIKVIEHKKLFEKWFDAVEEMAKIRLIEGEEIEGLKLVAGRGSREWINEKKAETFLIHHIGEEQAYDKKILSVAKAEKIIGKDTMAGMFESIQGKPLVAPVSDKRQRIAASAKADFAKVASKEDF